MLIRRFVPADAPTLCEIYYRSVHEVACAKYDRDQLAAWAPRIPDHAEWLGRLTEYETFVADDESGESVAWIAMSPTGYVDMLFALPQAVGRGVATALYLSVERAAHDRGLTTMTAHASLMAQPFFAKHGWTVVAHELHPKGDVRIARASMKKAL